MSMKRRWLRVIFLLMMTGVSFGGSSMNPKDIEDLLHIMNETKIEFSLPDKDSNGDGNQPQAGIDSSKRAPVHPKS